jgi:hypothetical protein
MHEKDAEFNPKDPFVSLNAKTSLKKRAFNLPTIKRKEIAFSQSH